MKSGMFEVHYGTYEYMSPRNHKSEPFNQQLFIATVNE